MDVMAHAQDAGLSLEVGDVQTVPERREDAGIDTPADEDGQPFDLPDHPEPLALDHLLESLFLALLVADEHIGRPAVSAPGARGHAALRGVRGLRPGPGMAAGRRDRQSHGKGRQEPSIPHGTCISKVGNWDEPAPRLPPGRADLTRTFRPDREDHRPRRAGHPHAPPPGTRRVTGFSLKFIKANPEMSM